MGKLTTYIENQKIAPATATKTAARTATANTARAGKLTAYIEENGITPQAETVKKSTAPTPLMTALSTGKTSGTEQAGESADLKGILKGAVTGARATQPKTDFKPINTNAQNTIQTPYDNKTEQFAYDLGKSLGSANPNTILGAVRYGLAKGVQGVTGAAEGIADLAYGGGSEALGWLTSLGGLAPNSFAQGFTDNAKKAFETDIAGSIGKGIADKSEVEIAKPIQFGGDVYNVAGNLLAGLGAGKAVSGATKLATDLTSKLAIGASAGGQSAQQAYKEGASVGKALTYGTAAGMLEASIESIAGGIPGLGKGVVGKAMEKLTSKASAAVQAIMSAAGEGAEEVLSDFITPYLQRIVYNPEAENATLEQMAKDFAMGAGLSGLMQGAGAIGNINTAKSNVTTPQTSTQNAANNVDVPTQIAPNISTKVNTPTQNATQAPTIAPNLQRVVSPVSTENATQGNVTADTKNNAVNSETHIDNRTMSSVGDRKTPAFQYQHPELHQYFEYAADLLSMEVENQIANDFMRPAAKKGSATEARVGSRYKAKGAVKALMDAGLTKPQILQSLQDIKNDRGSENYAAAKRVELVLDDMMTNGYAAYTGDFVPAVVEYVKAKQSIEGAKTDEQRQAEYDEAVDFIEGTPSKSLFPSNSLGAKITNGMPKSNVNAESSVGAATGGFDPYSRLSNKYGAIPEGENPVRVVDVPAQTSDTNKVSRGVRTALEAQATPESAFAQSAIQDAVADEKFSYIPITDKSSVEKANKTISDKGWDVAVKDWTADARKGVVSKDLIVQGQVLYNNAMNAGDVKGGVDILVDLVKMSRSGAQATQANRVLKTLSPEYQLYALQRSVQSMSDELVTKFEKRGFKGIVLDETLVKEYMDAKTDTEREAVMEKLKDNVASQVPSTWYDKWNAWRYLAMLGNPRTHIRNIVGNAGFVPVRGVKNVLSAGIENIFKVDTKTKALLTLKDSPLIEQAQKFYAQDEEAIMSLGKFDNWAGDINERRTIFKNKPVEALRKGNTNLLNKEDTWFAKPAYTNALAGYLKANKITADALSNGKVEQSTMDRAREYAIREAQRATYRDSNKFSDFVAGLGKTKSGAANVLVEGVLPFKRTPANILARAVEYSPAGLIKGLTYDLYQVKHGNMEAWQAIDNISAGLTGLGIVGLGAWLASMGLISGGKDKDDKTAGLNALTGYQNYALNVGGKSYTLDWLAPEALPFFVGVEFFNTLTDKSEKGITFADAITKVSNIAEPMLEMSMLQGVNDLIDSVKYSDNSNILGIAATSAVNYLSQGLPTIFGQVERITEPNRQTTYINSTSGVPTSIQYMLGKTANKIPFVDFQQRDYTDAFGNKQSSGSVFERALNNLINPAYVSTTKDNAVTNELKRLNEGKYLTRIPEQAARTFDYGGATYNLTKTEYDQYSKTLGQATYKLMQTMIDKSEYKNMTDTEKADVMAKIIGYSNDEAKRQLVTAKGKTYTSNNYQKAYEASKQGINVADYFLFKNALDKVDANGSATQLEISKALEQTNLSTDQKGALWQLQNDGASEKNPYTGTLAQKGLSPQKTIEIMSAYDNIKNSVDDNYVKTENSPGAAQVKAAYLNQWLTRQGYTSAQITAITDVFTTWQMIPIEKPSKKATAFVANNPMPK